MYNDLCNKDKQMYTQNGILHMLERNIRIKKHPERFQECFEQFEIIFTVEERIFDNLIEGYWCLIESYCESFELWIFFRFGIKGKINKSACTYN